MDKIALPTDLVARLEARGVDLSAPVDLPDSHTETAEQAAERRAIQARNRASRWLNRRPPMYADASLEAMAADALQAEAAQKARTWWQTPGASTLLAAGPVGTGKTFLAYALGNLAVDQGRWVEVWTVADLLADMRPDGDPAAERRARDCDLLILDDLFTMNVSPWAAETLTGVLDARVNAQRRQVVTTNAPSDAVETAWGGRLLDRLAYRWTVAVMAGESRRRAAW